MKKQLLLMMSVVIICFTSVKAQGGGGQRMTPEERTKATVEKMAPLNMDADTKTKAEGIIAEFYTSQQKAMEDMRASGSFDRETFAAKRKELSDARDGKLKAIFTTEQMKKWIEEIEPSTRPQRPAGGGGQ